MTEKDINRLQREVREFFDELWQVPRFAGARRVLRPHVDCYHTDDPHELTVVVELPGIDPRDVHIVATEVFQQMEIDYGAFERAVPLIEEVDPEGANASYERGLLTIVLPVVEQRPPGAVNVPIEVKAGR